MTIAQPFVGNRVSPRLLVLLVVVTVFWGLNWPIMKFALTDLPPLNFRWLCMAGGVIALWLWIRASGQSLRVPRAEWRTVAILAVPNMILWHLLAIQALKGLTGGKAAMLGYTMPVWALLIAVCIYRQPVAPRTVLGVIAAAAGALLLLYDELGMLAGQPVSVILMLMAAASWGWGTLLMRRMPVSISSGVLTFWMLLITLVVNGVAALAIEGPMPRAPMMGEWLAILYNAVIVFAVCHIAWFSIARELPPVASGLSIMMIPVLGVFSGALWLGEPLGWAELSALALILVAIATAVLPGKAAAQPKAR